MMCLFCPASKKSISKNGVHDISDPFADNRASYVSIHTYSPEVTGCEKHIYDVISEEGDVIPESEVITNQKNT